MAYSNPQQGHPEAAELRKRAGEYLRELRLKKDMKQTELARLVGFEYYTMVTQVEGGKARVPPDRMLDWARALGVDPKEFAQTLLRYYDPFMWSLLFGSKPKKRAS